MEKGKTFFCAKIGIVMPLFFKSEILFVVSSITKKGEIESASRPLIDFGN
jgi:hypothetical protein